MHLHSWKDLKNHDFTRQLWRVRKDRSGRKIWIPSDDKSKCEKTRQYGKLRKNVTNKKIVKLSRLWSENHNKLDIFTVFFQKMINSVVKITVCFDQEKSSNWQGYKVKIKTNLMFSRIFFIKNRQNVKFTYWKPKYTFFSQFFFQKNRIWRIWLWKFVNLSRHDVFTIFFFILMNFSSLESAWFWSRNVHQWVGSRQRHSEFKSGIIPVEPFDCSVPW